MTPGEGRRFAFTTGSAFGALGAFFLWKASPVGTPLIGVGLLLGVAGLLIPARLTPVYRGWMAVAHGISRVTTPIVMAVLYWGLLTPVGVIRRVVGNNPLEHQSVAGVGSWKLRQVPEDQSSDLTRQF